MPLATHFPPFAEAAFHEGRISSPGYLPFFSNRCVGEAIPDVMPLHPSCQLTVLCGHTHGEGVYQAAPNVEVRVAGAECGKPAITNVLVQGRRVTLEESSGRGSDTPEGIAPGRSSRQDS